MKKDIKYILVCAFAVLALFSACKKTQYTFGPIVTPTALSITTTLQGVNGTNPTGDGSGNITINVAATNALAYKIFWGTGDSTLTSSGTASYKYTKLDTNSYTITVNAIGTAGASTTLSKTVKVLYKYQIPSTIISMLTNGTSKNWGVAKDTVGHFGVGPASDFNADYYKAGPNEKAGTPCAYAGVVTFTQASSNSVTMNDVNGSSFIIGAATAFYGQAGGDGCYVVATGGVKTLGFAAANTGSNTSNSTGVIFNVPGTGLVAFGVGSTSYEILSLTSTVMMLRTIGADGNAWYQILRAK